jgi:hypothetical protein
MEKYMITKYYTIQTIEAWNQAIELKYLEGNVDYIDKSFIEPYHWLMDQMEKRLKSYNGEYPIWLWPKRQDLRKSGYLSKGQHGVLLEIELDENDVLLSDFEAWHFVLNNWFFSISDDEEKMFEEGKLLITKEKSWERIFDFSLLNSLDGWEHINIQGVTGRVDIKSIRLIKEFKSR